MSHFFKYILFFIFLFSSLPMLHSQDQAKIIVNVNIIDSDKNPQLIIFNKERKLIIADFKGKPPAVTQGVAATYSGIKMGYSFAQEKTKTVIKINLTCYFDPSKSWMKKEGKTPSVLDHEQGHFNITYIQTSRFADAISKYTFSQNWKEELLNLRQKYMDELETMQDNYDKKTRHGTIEKEQLWYSLTINEKLNEY